MKDKLAKLLIELDSENPGKRKTLVKEFVGSLREQGLDYQLLQILKIVEKKEQDDIDKNTLYITLSEPIDVTDLIKKVIGIEEDVKVNILINKNLKGGFIAQYDGKLYNGSISQQLQKIRDKILCQ